MTYRPSDEDRKALAFTDRLSLPALVERIVALEVAAAKAEHLETAHLYGSACMREAAERDRAEAAEAKVAAVEALADEWDEQADQHAAAGIVAPVAPIRSFATRLRAALGEARP